MLKAMSNAGRTRNKIFTFGNMMLSRYGEIGSVERNKRYMLSMYETEILISACDIFFLSPLTIVHVRCRLSCYSVAIRRVLPLKMPCQCREVPKILLHFPILEAESMSPEMLFFSIRSYDIRMARHPMIQGWCTSFSCSNQYKSRRTEDLSLRFQAPPAL